MRNAVLSVLMVFVGFSAYSKVDHDPVQSETLVNSLKYEQNGTVILRNGIGKINIPPGFKYLEPEQAEQVLTELWGNPRKNNMTLGLLMPENQSLEQDNCFVINVRYDEIGYVKDTDAGAINYNKLMQDMQQKTVEENEKRENAGFEPITLVGWAFKPYYDSKKKILHWAKEISLDKQEQHILNYQVKILGRKGVLILNAIAPMSELTAVQADINKLVAAVGFTESYEYQDFNPAQDKVAAVSISSLISGNRHWEVDFFALLSKYWTVLLIAAISFYRPVLDYIHELMEEDRKLSIP